MTDLGLARQADNEEFRVTKAGTTVGTLDYMSPEQARDSGLADIRSDLYSLGSTWFHLLAGHPPFPKGGLGERLHRILHEEPADIRSLNPAVSDDMASVLHRLLAKRRSKRYQTPTDLLRDLEALANGQAPLAPPKSRKDLTPTDPELETPQRSKNRNSREGRKTPRELPSQSRSDTMADKSTAEEPIPKSIPASLPFWWYGLLASIFLVLAAGIILAVKLHRTPQETPSAQQPDAPVDSPSQLASSTITSPSLPTQPKKTEAPRAGERTLKAEPPKKTTWPVLYQPSQPLDVHALHKEIEAPWAKPSTPSSTVQLVVGRLPGGASGKHFASLAAACKAIPAGVTGIIELRDNGPFFDLPATLADRSLVLRAAKGYQPLLVWDVQRMLEERRRKRERRESAEDSSLPIFLDVKRGNLTLENLHFAMKWPDVSSEGAALLRVEDGDVSISGCTFSVAGKPRDGLSLLRFGATRSEVNRCRFVRTFVRGPHLSILDLQAVGAQVLIEDSLLVGGDAPLFQIQASHARPTQLSTLRSTMIGGNNLIHVRSARNSDNEPAFHWQGWDVLLARNSPEVGGQLLRLSDDLHPRNMSWRAVNCLYAGWETLLAGTTTIAASDISSWRRLWGRIEGDYICSESWPVNALPDVTDVPAGSYRTASSPVAFAASSEAESLLGCNPDRLPVPRENWMALTFERFAVLAPPVPDEGGPPDIPRPIDQFYLGERLDLDRIDLGAHLQFVQQRYRLAPKVVLHLSGSGERLTSPIHLKGSNLTLYFEPPAEKAEPLVLVPAGRERAEALVEIEQGNLSIINGRLGFSHLEGARLLPWLIKMHGGDVRLFRSHLAVPPKESGESFRGLISLDGSSDAAAEHVQAVAVNESVLLSQRDAIAVAGIGARVVLTQTLLIAGDHAVRLTLDPDYTRQSTSDGRLSNGRANVQCLFDHTTVAARGAVLYLSDVKHVSPPAEPVIVQSHDCGFVNLFASRTSRPGLLIYDGEALSHGLLVWQSENDTFDRRLWFGALSRAAPALEKPEDHASWAALWGAPNLSHPQLDLLVYRTLDADRWSLERLLGWKAPGANLQALNLARKTPAKTRR
jgi:eukaryotic-like serine/threonine-protein kinase